MPDDTRDPEQFHYHLPTMPSRCHFCEEGASGTFQGFMLQGGKRYAVTLSLCAVHRHLIRSAGSRGRVHSATGIRYWLTDAG